MYSRKCLQNVDRTMQALVRWTNCWNRSTKSASRRMCVACLVRFKTPSMSKNTIGGGVGSVRWGFSVIVFVFVFVVVIVWMLDGWCWPCSHIDRVKHGEPSWAWFIHKLLKGWESWWKTSKIPMFRKLGVSWTSDHGRQARNGSWKNNTSCRNPVSFVRTWCITVV